MAADVSRRGLRRAASILAVVALATGAGACDRRGGSGDEDGTPASSRATPAEREAVRAAVVRFFTSNDVRVLCERTLTPRLFRLIFTGPAGCRKVAAEGEDDEGPKRVAVSNIRTTGKRATAHAALIGGDSAGARGVVSLAKGKRGWRTDDLSTVFLRSLVKAGLTSGQRLSRRVGRCIDARFRQMSDAEFARLGYSLMGHRPRATVQLLEALSECERRRRGVSSVRSRMEKNVTAGLRGAGMGRKEIACALRRLRSTVSDSLVIRFAAYQDRRLGERVTREVVAAAIACGARRPPDPGQVSPV